jgi:hypothetical protein
MSTDNKLHHLRQHAPHQEEEDATTLQMTWRNDSFDHQKALHMPPK